MAILAYVGYQLLLIECICAAAGTSHYRSYVYNADNFAAATGTYHWPNYKLEDVLYIGLYGGCSEGMILSMRFA